MVRPPRLGKHQGARETSISLAGSQTPSERPIRGIGEPQKQIGEDGFGVSGAPEALPIRIGPIEIGNRHSQHTSEIGFTKRPVQDWADAGAVESTATSAIANRATTPRFMRRGLPRTSIRGPAHRCRSRAVPTGH